MYIYVSFVFNVSPYFVLNTRPFMLILFGLALLRPYFCDKLRRLNQDNNIVIVNKPQNQLYV